MVKFCGIAGMHANIFLLLASYASEHVCRPAQTETNGSMPETTAAEALSATQQAAGQLEPARHVFEVKEGSGGLVEDVYFTAVVKKKKTRQES